jgi:nucleoside-diphosphate-sugar epimerase
MGVLGRVVAAQWAARHPGAEIVGETRTDRTHGELAAAGIRPALEGGGGEPFERVVFCAPPSGNGDYVGSVAAAAARVGDGGVMVFTSSASVYVPAPELLAEDAPVQTEGERPRRLLAAEEAVLARAEGRVVRLAGLYTRDRGAHGYYCRAAGPLAGHADSYVNQVHYEDAAAMVVAVLEKGSAGAGGDDDMRVYLGADASPMTRGEICAAAMEHPLFAGGRVPEFDGTGPIVVKAYDNERSRKVLGWHPRWESFAVFMREDAAKTGPAAEGAASAK